MGDFIGEGTRKYIVVRKLSCNEDDEGDSSSDGLPCVSIRAF